MHSLDDGFDIYWRDYVRARWRTRLEARNALLGVATDTEEFAREVMLREHAERLWYGLYRTHYMDRASRCERSTMNNDRHYVCPVIVDALVDGVAPEGYRARHMTERQAQRKADGTNNNTLRKEVQRFSSVLQCGVREGIVKRNVLKGYSLPRKVAPSVANTGHEGIMRLLRSVRDIRRPSINPGARFVPRMKAADLTARDTAMIVTQARGALRPCELVGLDRADYQPHERRLVIRKTKDKETRYVPLYDDMISVIDFWLRVRPRNAQTEKLYVSDRGLAITVYWWAHNFKRYARFAGLPDLTPLSLRHYGLTRGRKHELLAAARLAGHTKTTTTQHYLHDQFADTLEALAAVKQIDVRSLQSGRSAKRIM